MKVGDLVKQNHQSTNVPQGALGIITDIEPHCATVHFFGYGSYWLYQYNLEKIDSNKKVEKKT